MAQRLLELFGAPLEQAIAWAVGKVCMATVPVPCQCRAACSTVSCPGLAVPRCRRTLPCSASIGPACRMLTRSPARFRCRSCARSGVAARSRPDKSHLRRFGPSLARQRLAWVEAHSLSLAARTARRTRRTRRPLGGGAGPQRTSPAPLSPPSRSRATCAVRRRPRGWAQRRRRGRGQRTRRRRRGRWRR